MQADFLHNHRQFGDLIRIVADAEGIAPVLVEKDYWIMQSLHGLQQLGMAFELKGGTSLSKGYGLISRFSEDIDIRIEPPADPPVMAGRNHDKPAHIESRKAFYDRLARTITIDGIAAVERDTAFDDIRQYRGAGIRLCGSARCMDFSAMSAGCRSAEMAVCWRRRMAAGSRFGMFGGGDGCAPWTRRTTVLRRSSAPTVTGLPSGATEPGRFR